MRLWLINEDDRPCTAYVAGRADNSPELPDFSINKAVDLWFELSDGEDGAASFSYTVTCVDEAFTAKEAIDKIRQVLDHLEAKLCEITPDWADRCARWYPDGER